MSGKKKPYFSIVMPAYGVESYIEKAIKSIQDQTYADWEIIVVDDKTPDRSAQIAERMAEADERIRVVRHEKNRGLGPARNTGMDEARGEYIWFMDPDDYVDGDILEKIRDSLLKNPAEAVIFGLIEEYYDRKGNLDYTHVICPEERLYDSQEELRRAVIYLEQQTLYGYAWNKVYNLEYMREMRFRFENVKLIEDIHFNVQYFMDIKRLNVLGIAPYHYAKRMGKNLTNAYVPEYFRLHKQRIEMLFDQLSYWNLCTRRSREILGSLYARYILSALERNCDRRSGMRNAQRYQWCRRLFAQGLFNELIPQAKAADSKILSLSIVFLRMRKAIPCMMMGRGIYMIRKMFPMVYSRVKSER